MFIISPLGRHETADNNKAEQQYNLLSEYEQQAERLISARLPIKEIQADMGTQWGHYVCQQIIDNGVSTLIIQQVKDMLDNMEHQAMTRPWSQMTARELGDISYLLQHLTT